MPDYLTPQGLIKQRQDQIKARLEAQFRTIYGPSVQLAPESTQGQKIGVWSEGIADIWDLLQVVFDSFHPDSVTGFIQDLLYALNSITRLSAVASTVPLTITGTPLTVINAGFEVSTEAGLTFSTDTDAEIDAGGTVTVDSTATVTGPKTAESGTVTVIKTPVIGVDSVINNVDATLGRDQETSAEFRLRRTVSTAIAAQNIPESAFSQLLDLGEVTDAKIYENKTNVTDPETGILPHRWMAVVAGGEDADIGPVIWHNTPFGIASQGEEEVKVDVEGGQRTVYFQRPELKEVNVRVDIRTNGLFPGDGADQIKKNIVEYASGQLFIETGFPGFRIGQKVTYTRVFSPINMVQGHSIELLEIWFTGDAPGTSDLPVEFAQKSTWAESRITVNILI